MRVAVVVDRVQDYQIPVIRGIEAVLRAVDAALLVVVSHPQYARRGVPIRRLVRSGRLDAVIVTGMTDAGTGLSRMSDVVKLVEGVPVVSMGARMPGVPAVLPDNPAAVAAVMDHLLDGPGRSRPLLVAGPVDNDDSREREAAFRRIAAERNLVLPRTPVVHAGFDRESAYRWTIDLLAAGRDFDAVVAANDDMAMGVLDALHEQGVRIPEDVAVVGFDNTAGASRADPPLTSVDARLEDQGRAAAESVLAQLAGRPVPAEVRVPAPLVIRGSSVVLRSEVLLRPPMLVGVGVGVGVGAGAGRSPGAGSIMVDDVLARMVPMPAPAGTQFRDRLQEKGTEWLRAMIDGTLTADQDEAFAAVVRECVAEYPEPLWWRNATAGVQAGLMAVSGGRLPDAVQSGLLRMVLHSERALAAVREERDREQLTSSQHVLGLNRALAGCGSLADLVREISAYLPRLNIGRCFIVLLERPVDHQAADRLDAKRAAALAERPVPRAGLAMSYRNGTCTQERDRALFGMDQLLPADLAEELDRGSLTLQPLFSESRWFGFILHEQTVLDRHTGEALRQDVCQVLDSIARAHELTERAAELEALVVERTAQLELEVLTRQAAQESLREANADLRRALLLDGLTGLQNRPSFDEHLLRSWHRHLRSGDPISLLMVDVDHFKLYNDTFGHLAGDKCLRQVAGCLRAAVPRNEDIVARYGGEEFAVILPETDRDGAGLVAERLLREVRAAAIAHSGSDGAGRYLSISVGIGCSSVAAVDSLESLLNAADQALYAAKRNGRDCAVEF